MTASIDVIIPYFRDTAGREELMRYTSGLWEERHGSSHGARVYTSGDGGSGRPFNRGRARNLAAAQGEGEWLVLWDTDVPPPTDERLSSAIRTAGRWGWSPVFARTVTFTPSGTRRLLDASSAGFSYELEPGDMHNLLPMCIGPTVVRRRIFNSIGGYDERFVGWGYEDTALRAVLTALYEQPDPPPHDAVCWSLSLDPEDPNKRIENVANRALYLQEYQGLGRGEALELLARRHSAK